MVIYPFVHPENGPDAIIDILKFGKSPYDIHRTDGDLPNIATFDFMTDEDMKANIQYYPNGITYDTTTKEVKLWRERSDKNGEPTGEPSIPVSLKHWTITFKTPTAKQIEYVVNACGGVYNSSGDKN
jgi:hypothetical protein